MENAFFPRLAWDTSQLFRKSLTSLRALTLLLVMCLSIGNVWGGKITDYTKLVSGAKYYIGATNTSSGTSTDYYLSIPDLTSTNAQNGSGTTSQSSSFVVTAIGSGTSWAFQLDNEKYIGIGTGTSSSANGKVQLKSSSYSWTLSNASNLIVMQSGTTTSRYLKFNYNNGNTKFGSYGSSTGVNIWFEEAIVQTAVTLNKGEHGAANGSVTYTVGKSSPDASPAPVWVSPEDGNWTLTGYFDNNSIKVINADNSLVANTTYAGSDGNWKYSTSTLTLTALWESASSPSIGSSPSSKAFGSINQYAEATAQEFTITGANLTEVITATLSNDQFEFVGTPSLTAEGGTVSVKPKTTTSGDLSANLHLASGKTNIDVALTATIVPVYVITWKANGQKFDTTHVVSGSKLVLPTNTPDPTTYCDGKVFRGWYDNTYSDPSTEPTYAKVGDNVSSDKTYHAVFATSTTSGEGGSYEFTYNSHTGWTISSAAVDKSTYYLLQKTDYIESPSIIDLSSVTSIVVGAGKFNNKGAYKVMAGSTQVGTASVPSGTGSSSTTFNQLSLSGSGTIQVVNTDGATSGTTTSSAAGTRLYAITVNYGPVTTYSDFTTTCTLNDVDFSISNHNLYEGDEVADLMSWVTLNSTDYTGTITFSSSDDDVFTVVDGGGLAGDAGSCTLTVTAPAAGGYRETIKSCTVTVNEKTCTITPTLVLDDAVEKNIGDADFTPETITENVGAGQTVVYASSNTDVATIVDNKVHIVASGSSNITASVLEDGEYCAATSDPCVLTVNKAQFSVAWKVNGEVYSEGDPTTQVEDGSKVTTLPTDPTPCHSSITFMGWTDDAIASPTDDAPAVLFTNAADAPDVTDNVTYHAVWAKGTSATQNVTLKHTCSSTTNMSGNNDANSKFGLDANVWSVVGAKNSANNNVGLNKDGTIRLYYHADGGNTLTVSTLNSKNIISITPTVPQESIKIHVNSTEITPAEGVYTINATSFVVSVGGTAHTYVSQIVMAVDAGIAYKNYSTTCAAPVAIPTFSPDGGKYTEDQNVTISCETDEATIRYTLDGTEPTSTSTEYSAAIPVSSNVTIKARAFKSGMLDSEIATADYVIDYGFVNSIADFIQRAPTESYDLIFTNANPAQIIGIDGNTMYIQDNTRGIMIYGNTTALPEGAAVGKKMIGKISGIYKLYSGQDEMTSPVYDGELVISDGTRPTPVDVTALDAEAYTANQMTLVKLKAVYFQTTTPMGQSYQYSPTYTNVRREGGEVDYRVYNILNSLTGLTLPDITTQCDVTGILLQYKSSTSTTYELLPVFVADVNTLGATAAAPTYNPEGGADLASAVQLTTTNVVTVTPAANTSIVINEQEYTAAHDVNVTETCGVTATAKRTFYADNTVTYYYKPNKDLIRYNINGLGTDSHGNQVTATVSDEQGNQTSAPEGKTVTLAFSNATHYTFTSVTVVDADESLVSLNDDHQFTMPAKEVTVTAVFTEDPKYTVTYELDGGTSEVPTENPQYAGIEITLPAAATKGTDLFKGWKASTDGVTYAAKGKYTMTAANVTFTAQWGVLPDFANGDWVKVTNASELTAGSYVIVAATSYDYAMKTYASGDFCGIQSCTKDGGLLTYNSAFGVYELQNYVNADKQGIALYDVSKKEYLYITSGGKMRSQATADNASAWTFSISDNVFTMANVAYNTYKLKYNHNGGSGRFQCYTSALVDVDMYKYYAPTFKISFNGNGENVKNLPGIQMADANLDVVLTEQEPTRGGFNFTGWEDIDGNEYIAGTKYHLTENITLYAQWEKKEIEGTPVVIVVKHEKDGKYYAMKNDLTCYEIEVLNGKMLNVPDADKEGITWYQKAVDGGVTFMNSYEQYLTKGSSDAALALTEITNYITWQWNAEGFYENTNKTGRTFMVQNFSDGFRNYAKSNIDKSGFSSAAMFLTEYITGIVETPRTGLTIGKLGTFCETKAVAAGMFEGAEFYEILNKDAASKNVTLQEVLELEAGMPYIIVPTAEQIRVIYNGESKTAQHNNGLYGWLDTDFKFDSQIDSKDVYFVNGGRIVRCGDNCTIKTNRAYIVLDEITQVSEAPGRRRLVLGVEGKGVATGMEEAVIMNNGELKKVVIDGQFYILRDGKVFDAQGKLVK